MRTFFAQPFAHTFSIVARHPRSGQIGVAVQSHWFSVGSVVPWVQAGVGAVATQSMVEVNYGPHGLARMAAGEAPLDALTALLNLDESQALRQVAFVNAAGDIAVHTGSQCVAEANHCCGAGFSAQANMMRFPGVPEAMAADYTKALEDESLDLAECLMRALEAAQAAGGDIRGMQSAAMRIASAEKQAQSWQGLAVDVRVEDHPQPLAELRRLVQINRAYTYMNLGDELLAVHQVEGALAAYQQAAEICPEIAEMPFWQAVSLVNIGNTAAALPIFTDVFSRDPLLAEMLLRLPPAGLIEADPQTVQKIYALKR